MFFDPSMQEVVYEGAYPNLRGVPMSRAFASTLDLSFEVRGGLFKRQLHHWAVLIFVAARMVHMLRIFFTGAFRRPRVSAGSQPDWYMGSPTASCASTRRGSCSWATTPFRSRSSPASSV